MYDSHLEKHQTWSMVAFKDPGHKARLGTFEMMLPSVTIFNLFLEKFLNNMHLFAELGSLLLP